MLSAALSQQPCLVQGSWYAARWGSGHCWLPVCLVIVQLALLDNLSLHAPGLHFDEKNHLHLSSNYISANKLNLLVSVHVLELVGQ